MRPVGHYRLVIAAVCIDRFHCSLCFQTGAAAAQLCRACGDEVICQAPSCKHKTQLFQAGDKDLRYLAELGAALMYAFDPDRGKRRRASLRDKLAADAMSVTGRDLTNRVHGLYHLWQY